MTHVRTSPFYPQSNGKIERWDKSLQGEYIRPGTLSLEDARRLVESYVEHYNNILLNSAIGYITPEDTPACVPHGGGAAAGDPCREGSEVGSRTETKADSSPVRRVKKPKR